MRELNLDRLRTLLTVAEHASFAAAARELHLAPPTVSLHIAELESRIGAPLLVRKRGHVSPTAVGATLLTHARRLLGDVEHTLDTLRRQVDGLYGRVRLGASTGALAYLLPAALAQISRQQPDIDVQLTVLTSHDTMTRLHAGQLDIGLVALPQRTLPGVEVEAWRRDPVYAFLPADWVCPPTLDAAWLAARPLILNDHNTRLMQDTASWFAACGQRPEPRIRLNYNDAIKRLVAAGYGATLLPLEGEADTEPGIQRRALSPPFWRELGLASRRDDAEQATRYVLSVLRSLAPPTPDNAA